MKIHKPAIVIVAFNRLHSLERLLEATQNANYEDGFPDLIISIDYSESHQAIIKTIADAFEWKGNKKVIAHKENLGLKAHIFFCADMSTLYHSVIILEDDLYVTPAFYNFSQNALNACEGHEEIAGIALYNNTHNEAVALPFEAVKTDGDFYLMQVPCSWGQIWTQKQWENFKNWYHASYSSDNLNLLPKGIRNWSEKSWKKPFFLYLRETKKFFAYPYVSYAMNLNEQGTNVNSKDFKFLNGLKLGTQVTPQNFNKNMPKYDMAYEMLPEYLNRWTHALKDYDYEIDFYGSKLDGYEEDQWVLTALEVTNFEKCYGIELKPIELNVIYNIQGKSIFLSQKKHIKSIKPNQQLLKYHYPIPPWYFPFFEQPLIKRIHDTLLFSLKRIFKTTKG